MEKHRDRPFFIARRLLRPHCPFIAPQQYFDLYPLDRIPAPAVGREALTGAPAPAFFTSPPHWDVSETAQRETIRAYYASISFLDAQVGRLLDALDRLGLAERTIVVFISDHGYHLGDGGQWMKQTLFERSARAPLIVAGAAVGAKGRATSRIVEFLDVYPTLAELTGVQAPGGLEGRSLVPLLKNPGAEWTHPALTQVMRGAALNQFMGYSVRNERWRYTEWDGGKRGVELYDEIADPHELKNLATDPAHRKTAEEMQRVLTSLKKN